MALAIEQLRATLAATRPREGRPFDAAQSAHWSAARLAGRLSELSAESGAAALTWAVRLAAQVQAGGRPVGWVTPRVSAFYPPDAAANGVVLEALAVVRVPDTAAVGRAAERLARSGGFGLVVLDLSEAGPRAALTPALQGRLVQHALRSGTAVLCLTEKPERSASLGSLVSLRVVAERVRVTTARVRGAVERPPGAEDEAAAAPFRCGLRALKDKRGGPGWHVEEACHGPPGLR